MDVFLYSFALHLLFPLLNPWSKNCHQFFNSSPFAIYFNWFLPFVWYLSIISFLLSPDDLEYALFIPTFLYTVHRLMIALKYASLSKSEFDRYKDAEDAESAEYFMQIHLLTGWNQANAAVIAFEISAAAARCGIKLDKLRFFMPQIKNKSGVSSNHSLWDKYLEYSGGRVHFDAEAGNSKYILVRDVCFAFPYLAIEWLGEGIYFYVSGALNSSYCMIILLLPFLIYENGNPESGWTILFLFTSSILIIQFGFLMTSFLGLSILSMFRNVRIARTLKEMVELKSKYLGENIKYYHYNSGTSQRLRSLADHSLSTRSEPVERAVPVVWSASMIKEVGDCEDTGRPSTLRLRQDVDSDDEAEGEFNWLKDVCDVPMTVDEPLLVPSSTATSSPKPENEERGVFFMLKYCCQSLCKSNIVESPVNPQPKEEQDVYDNFRDHAKGESTPKISLHCPENIYAWLYARSIMKDFGRRFNFRTNIYIGATVIVLLVIMIFLIVVLSKATDPQQVLGYVLTRQALVSVVFLAFYVFAFIMAGSVVNDEYDYHRRLFMNLLVQCCKGLSEIEAKKRYLQKNAPDNKEELTLLEQQFEMMEEIDRALTAVKMEIETTGEMEPVEVLGIPAKSNLAMSVLTATGSFFAYIGTVLQSSSNPSGITGSSTSTTESSSIGIVICGPVVICVTVAVLLYLTRNVVNKKSAYHNEVDAENPFFAYHDIQQSSKKQ